MASEGDAQGFYEAVRSELSQGDIVSGIVWGAAAHPLSLCRPHNESLDAGGCVYGPVDKIGGTKPFEKKAGIELVHANARRGYGMVMWNDCQIDYLKNRQRDNTRALVAVAPVLPISQLPDQLWGNLKTGRRAAAFYLPASEAMAGTGLENGAFVDLRHLWPLYQRSLEERVASLPTGAVRALYDHLFWFLAAYRRSGNLACPACGTLLDEVTPFEGHAPSETAGA